MRQAVHFILFVALVYPIQSTELEICRGDSQSELIDASSYQSQYFNNSLPNIVETFRNWGGYSGSENLRKVVLLLVNGTNDEGTNGEGSSFSYDNEEFQEYMKDLIFYAAPGIVMFVVTFLFGLIMMISRCCCARRCCKPKKELDEYTCCQRYWPLSCLNIVALLSASVAIVSIMYLNKVRTGAENMVCSMDEMSTETSESFQVFEDHMKVYDTSLDSLQVLANSMSLDVTESQVQDTSAELGTKMDILSANYESANPSTISRDYVANDLVCAVSSVPGQSLSMSDSTRFDILVPLFTEVEVFDQVTKPILQSGIDAASIAIEFSSQIVNYTTQELPDLIVEIDKASSDKTKHWQTGSFAFFFFVFFAVFVAIGSFVAYLTPCKFDDKIAHMFLHCSWFFSWGFAAVLFLFCGLGIPIAIVFSDTCVILQEVPTDIDLYFGNTLNCNGNSTTSTASCDILASCFEDSAPSYLNQVLDLVGEEGNVNFADEIYNYSSYLNDSSTNIESLHASHLIWAQATQDELLEFMSCKVETSDGDSALNALNQALGGTSYNRSQCYVSGSEDAGSQYESEMNGTGNCAPDASHPGTAELHDMRARVIQTLRLENWWMTTDMVDRYISASNLSSSLTVEYLPDVATLELYVNQSLQIGLDSVSDWNTLVDNTQDETCGFVGAYYDDITGNLCSESLEGFAGATLSMFVVALLGWPQIVFSIYVSIRQFGAGQAGKESGSNKVAPKVILD